MNKYQSKLPPGSPEAIASYCECPVMDNGRGKGSGHTDDDGKPLYWVNSQCPLHGIPSPDNTLPDSI